MAMETIICTGRVRVLILASLLSWGCSSAEEPHSIRVGYSPFAVNLPFFVAMEEGYFEQEGILVDPREMPTADAHTAALLSGRVDATVSMPTLTALRVAEESRGEIPFAVILFNWLTEERSPDGFVVTDKVNSLADLGGLEVGTIADVTWRAFLRVIVEEAAGEPPNSIIDLPPGSHLGAVTGGRVAGVFSIEPILALAENSGEVHVIGRGAMARYLRDPLVAGGFTISRAFAEAKPEEAAAYRSALLRAGAEIESDPTKYLDLLQKYTGIPEKIARKVQLNRYVPADAAAEAELQGTIRVYEELGLIAQEVEAGGFLLRPHGPKP